MNQLLEKKFQKYYYYYFRRILEVLEFTNEELSILKF